MRITEHQKKIIIAAAITAVAAAILYLYVTSPNINLLKDTHTEKVLELSNVSVTGWDKGEKSFEIYAKNSWTNRGQTLTEFNDVTDGKLFRGKRILVKNLIAKKVAVLSYRHETEVFGDTLEARPIKALMDLKGLSSDEAARGIYTLVESYHMLYNSDTKKTMADEISIFDRKFDLKSSLGEIDHEKRIATFMNSPVLTAPGYAITGTTMEVYFKDDRARIFDQAEFDVKNEGKPSTHISGKEMFFSTKNYDAQFSGNVKVVQKGKLAFSDSLKYENASKTATLIGNVRSFFKKAGAIFKQERINQLRNAEAKKALGEETFLTCGTLKISTKSGNAAASENVYVQQKTRQAKADFADYNDDDETITMRGNVFLRKNNEWLKTQRIVVSLKKETFDAYGKVESQFRLKK